MSVALCSFAKPHYALCVVFFPNSGITHVIQYDFPTGRETYLHRMGRTGRNGKTGVAISLATQEDMPMVEKVETYLGYSLPRAQVPVPNEAVKQVFLKRQKQKKERKPQKGEAVSKGILALSVGGGRRSKMRTTDLVGAICSIEGITVADIGIIDIRDSLSYVEILNHQGPQVLEALVTKTIKGKIRKVRQSRRSVGTVNNL